MSGRLDIDTPRGRANEAHNDKCFAVYMDYFDLLGATLKRLPKAHTADGLLLSPEKQKLGLIEVKSRHDFTEKEFFARWGTWLVTNKKIVENIRLARKHRIPFIGAMHIVQSRVVLVKTIFENGQTCPGVEVRLTSTQATINGGTALRDNAFIPMHDALRLTY